MSQQVLQVTTLYMHTCFQSYATDQSHLPPLSQQAAATTRLYRRLVLNTRTPPVMLAMTGHMVVSDTALGTLMVPGYWSLQMG